MITECEVEKQLFNWAYWVKDAKRLYESLWYPKNVIDTLMKKGFYVAVIGKKDDDSNPDAEKVDKMLHALMKYNREQFDCLFIRFMAPTKSQLEMSSIVGCSRSTFVWKLQAGLGWVAGSLNQSGK